MNNSYSRHSALHIRAEGVPPEAQPGNVKACSIFSHEDLIEFISSCSGPRVPEIRAKLKNCQVTRALIRTLKMDLLTNPSPKLLEQIEEWCEIDSPLESSHSQAAMFCEAPPEPPPRSPRRPMDKITIISLSSPTGITEVPRPLTVKDNRKPTIAPSSSSTTSRSLK